MKSAARHIRKMRGLYVEFSQSGTVLTPSEIADSEARTMIEDVQETLDFMMPAYGDDGAFARTQTLLTHAAELTVGLGQVQEALASDPDATLAGVRRWIAEQQANSEPVD